MHTSQTSVSEESSKPTVNPVVRFGVPADDDELERVAKSDARTMIYSSRSFWRFLETALGIEVEVLVVEENARPVGFLPFCTSAGPGGTVINSLPWYGTHGGCTMDPSASAQARNQLLQAFRALVVERNAVVSCVVLSPFEVLHEKGYVEALQPTARDDRTGMFLPLVADPVEQMSFMHQKTRNALRKAQRQALEIVDDDSDEAWEFLQRTHQENITALGGKPKPPAHFAALRRAIPPHLRRLAVAHHDQTMVGALLTLQFNSTVEYFVPAVRHEFRTTQAMSLLIWESMRRAAKDGFGWWNWGGTWKSQHSLYLFKSRWGGIDLPYSYLISSSPDARLDSLAVAERMMSEHPYFYIHPLEVVPNAN